MQEPSAWRSNSVPVNVHERDVGRWGRRVGVRDTAREAVGDASRERDALWSKRDVRTSAVRSGRVGRDDKPLDRRTGTARCGGRVVELEVERDAADVSQLKIVEHPRARLDNNSSGVVRADITSRGFARKGIGGERVRAVSAA